MGGTHKRRLQILVAGAGAILALVMFSVTSASASSAKVRVGPAPPLPPGARPLGTVSPSQPLHLTIAMHPRDPAALQAFATAVSTPGSAEFHHYVTVGQFAQRFGPTSASIAAVESSLRNDGLTVGTPMANHLTIPVTGAATRIEKGFSLSLHHVRLAGGRIAYANNRAPLLPASVASVVQGVVGLDNLVLPRPRSATVSHPKAHRHSRRLSSRAPTVQLRAHAAVRDVTPTPTCSGALAHQATAGAALDGSKGYTADQIASAYGFSSLQAAGDVGAGQTIAMYELGPYDPQDVSTYQSCYGTSVPVSNINVDGGPGTYGSAGNTDDGEETLDIEQAIGIAPGASILVYQGPNSGNGDIDTYSAIVSQDRAKIVSSSWGICEPDTTAADVQSENTLFQEAAAQGQSVFGPSGDQGSEDCSADSNKNTALAVDDPASQPFVTGVGATTLYAGSNASPTYYTPGAAPQESPWNDGVDAQGAGFGTGGGLSATWPMPSYQSGAPSSLGVINGDSTRPAVSCGSTYCREVPDVSAAGDDHTGYVVNSNMNNKGGWRTDGGTSASVPVWAAFTALVNAQSACHGQTVGFANPALYQIAGRDYAANFNDTTNSSPITGLDSNDALQKNNDLYPVTPNYDMATGLGSMNAPMLAASLCSATSPVSTVTVSNPGPQSGVVGQPASLQVHASDSGGAALTYSATGLPAGLSIDPTSGVISGTPTTAQITVVRVTATDTGGSSGSALFVWIITSSGGGAGGGGGAAGSPAAAFQVTPAQPAAGLPAVFDGLASADPGAMITSYSWDFGDGSTGRGALTTHLFHAAGTYTVTLTVADRSGATASVQHAVTVRSCIGLPVQLPPVLQDLRARPEASRLLGLEGTLAGLTNGVCIG